MHHQKMANHSAFGASKKGCSVLDPYQYVRHKDICPLFEKWKGVVQGKARAESMAQVWMPCWWRFWTGLLQGSCLTVRRKH